MPAHRPVPSLPVLALLSFPVHARNSATETLLSGLTDIYLLLKTILLLLSVFSIIAIAVHAYRGQFAWGWLTSLGFSAALLILSPYILGHAVSYNPVDGISAERVPSDSASNTVHVPIDDLEHDRPQHYRDHFELAIRHHCHFATGGDFSRYNECTALPWFHPPGRNYITIPSDHFVHRVCIFLGGCSELPRIPFDKIPPRPPPS